MKLDATLRQIEKFIPHSIYKFFQPAYHYVIALTGALYYRFPARRLYVIGVTGTKGKSSTVEIINAILESAGYKTALSNTIRFKIGDESKPNMFKMSMPGRFFMQKFLSDAVGAGCTHAVVEITSEGARQFRHRYIDLDTFVFTNLAPEHIESHGSYEAYREAKLEILRNMLSSTKLIKTMVINADDTEGERFLRIPIENKVTYSLSDIEAFHEDREGVRFIYQRELFTSPLIGTFNAYNILAAIKTAELLNTPLETIQETINTFGRIAGRAEHVGNENYEIVVDYAHTPDSLIALYSSFGHAKKRICVLGNTGGGRDTWKRAEMGRIADEYCDNIILTNEDPYDEDPLAIVEEMKEAIKSKPIEIILDRRVAITKALRLAKEGDAVLITGKGTDPYIMGPNGEKTPWSDAGVVKEELSKINSDK